jgi:hypothetical protein
VRFGQSGVDAHQTRQTAPRLTYFPILWPCFYCTRGPEKVGISTNFRSRLKPS